MKLKSLTAVLLACVLCFVLCACGISKEEAVGTWSGTYTYDGNSFAVAFVLSEEGEYGKAVYKNGSLSSSESGTWEIDGGDVVLHEDGNVGVSTVYEFNGEALVNNDHEFYKQ